jgi:hypothetical protein
MFESFKKRHPQYSHEHENPDLNLRTAYWQPALEICLGYGYMAGCQPDYTQLAVDGIINSIPAGSIYFGGTDPGRGLPTAFCKSHADADPFYTLTQNALADGTYLEYLRRTYGERSKLLDAFIQARRSDPKLPKLDSELKDAMKKVHSLRSRNSDDASYHTALDKATGLQEKIDERTDSIWEDLARRAKELTNGPGTKAIYIPTADDVQQCFQNYLDDARKRLTENKLKEGEDVKVVDDRVQVSGAIAVMEINALLARNIFDKNPDKEFYVEESFPLDWMYPHLEPHGLIMKLDRQALAQLPDDVVQRDHDYWAGLVGRMIGGWLHEDTPVSKVAAFVERVQLKHDFGGFKGDRRFVENDYARQSFSKWRSSIAGVYAWRADHSADAADKLRMAREADFAYRQAWVLCPDSPEAVFRYANFLAGQNRKSDALAVASTAAKFPARPGFDPATVEKMAESLKQAEAPRRPATAGLELRLVEDAPSSDAERLTQAMTSSATGKPLLESLYVQKTALLDGAAVRSAQVRNDPLGHRQIEVSLTDAGGKRLAEITRQEVGRRLAIVIDGRLCSAPVIRERISGGTFEISGVFSDEEAQTLAGKINGAIVSGQN